MGTARHTKAAELLREATKKVAPHVEHYAETRFRDIPGFDPKLADMTVADFLKQSGLDIEIRGAKGGLIVNPDGKLGDLELDLASINPQTGRALIWI